jgi:hypothetical protein
MPVEETVFSAETLVANMNDGKVYWKVKGGQYGKYGVTVWPETLAEIGIDVNTLDPKETYNLDGYTAFVMLKDGKPSKVFRLVSKE